MNNLQKFFRNKKVLITGHTGFKGGWLAQILLNWNADITGLALEPSTNPNLFESLDLKDKVHNYFADIRNFKTVKDIISKEKPEIVFHLAAQPLVRDSYDDPLYTFETNIIGTANILQAIKEVGGVKSAILITTDKVYEEKEKACYYKECDKLGGYDPYSASKASAEIVIDSYLKSFFNPEDYKKKHQTLIASVRAGNVIGGGDWMKDRILPDIIKSIFEDTKLIIRNPESVRPWQFVLEPLYGYLLLAEKLYKGQKNFCGAWNFGPKKENYLTVKALAEKIFEILGKKSYEIKRDPSKHESKWLGLDISKSQKILGWRPVLTIGETLEVTVDWYKNFYGKKEEKLGFFPQLASVALINDSNSLETKSADLTNMQIKEFFNKI